MDTIGRLFRVRIYGESHGREVGVLLEGVPPGIPLGTKDFADDLERRRGGRTGTTARREPDIPRLRSGWYRGSTTGRPLLISFANRQAVSRDYREIRWIPRPGQADWVAHQKYHGYQDHRGGGGFSGRLTLGLVAAGVVAKKILGPVEFASRVAAVGGRTRTGEIQRVLKEAARKGNSLGGIVHCRINGVPAGLGEPFFDSVESLISHVLFAIPGVKGVEFGAGFQAAAMTGDEHNDGIENVEGKTLTNHAGGINGGITSGNELRVQVGFRPPASISRPQRSIHLKTGKKAQSRVRGRHDTCFVLRCPVIVESVVAMVLADFYLLRRSQLPEGLKSTGN